MKFFAYTRCSTEGQAVDGVSLAVQEEKIRQWVGGNGRLYATSQGNPEHELRFFSDAGVSGSSTKGRPGLEAALVAVIKARGTLIVYSLSRLARSTQDATRILQTLQAKGCDLVILDQQIDTSTASGKVFFAVVAAFAQFERDLCSERTKAALAYKRGRGERTSRHTPYGYDVGPDGLFVVNAEEQKAIEWMRVARVAGKSYRGIARALENVGPDGVETKQGGKHWDSTTVKRLIDRKPVERVA